MVLWRIYQLSCLASHTAIRLELYRALASSGVYGVERLHARKHSRLLKVDTKLLAARTLIRAPKFAT